MAGGRPLPPDHTEYINFPEKRMRGKEEWMGKWIVCEGTGKEEDVGEGGEGQGVGREGGLCI